MVPTSASPSEPGLLVKHLHCSICMDEFTDPVTTACGHSFCKQCLVRSCNIGDRGCPLCNNHISRIPDVNIVLRDIVEQLKEKYTGAPGEVACDVCSDKKLKAKKSCLVCLASYCSVHLDNHLLTERLKGHKLIEPVENLDARACLKHGRPLELYSRERRACICVLCMEGQEEVVSTEDEWKKKRSELDNTRTELNENIAERITKTAEIEEAFRSCKDQLEDEWWDIDSVFNAVIAIVEEAQARARQPIEDRIQVLENEAKDLKYELKAEINKLGTAISELDDISVLEDHILFLQKYPSITDTGDIINWEEVNLDTSVSFGTIRKITTVMLEKVQQEMDKLTSIELRRIPKFSVDVKLDPDSAHQRLVLSEDRKEVKDGGENQKLPEVPERFDIFSSVVAQNTLSSGKSYWEVEVNNKTGWDIGLVRGGANRKGKLRLSPDNGYWVIVHYEEDKYAALTAPPVRIHLKDKPEKVGVFVDYEEDLVSFYDVKAESHIYSFTECSFKAELYPYFSPHVKQEEKNSEPLIICREIPVES
ncbi:E3 ubiquitin-protein ligase TRIM21-like [Oreochromis niloticus]|uniref:E3 ubiquitin-protein ligase TRIM21-like n=1 Tax=Oreochromis niloticus TaxID=8128 RepID=UPI000393E128|nr:E3 ubiquitin-protein ligase TRIM21-like [Oreochromis niloticus]XP_005459303.1 E3 ubiquitin-protein ligase TRIM21-like [Oreochromis niloticus]